MRLAAIALLAATAASTQAQDGACTIAPYRGASSADGAVAEVRMRNRGRPCAIPTYGAPNEKRNPADTGRIVTPPAHGEARFVAPNAEYLPAHGFAGDDAFVYEAYARGTGGTPVRLLVSVKVRVLPTD